jgi:hypothetical protein
MHIVLINLKKKKILDPSACGQHLYKNFKHAWQKLSQDSSTQKIYIINVVSIYFNRNWRSIYPPISDEPLALLLVVSV